MDKQNVLKRGVIATSVAAMLLTASLSATAAGMGKITVLSALGQPLRAELDITATREEQGSLAAKVASADAFRQANLEYTGTLSSVKFVLDKRPDGRPYFKIQTDRPVSDPFIDMLVELSWASGRLVREYAFLLDPPDMKPSTVSAPAVEAPVVQAPAESATATAPTTAPEPAAQAVEPIAKPQAATPESTASKATTKAPVKTKTKSAPEKTEVATESDNTHKVKAGDTLGKIATEALPEGVTLNQMLVTLFNNNRDAFAGGNMNRLRAGKILKIPDVTEAAAVSVGEARKVVIAQLSEFNTYRNGLAAAASQSTPSGGEVQQSSGGAIAPALEEKAPAGAGKDKLQVSRSEAAGAGKLSEEDRIARQKALTEANSRIADLEKNLGDLKQLAEIKSQAAAPKDKKADKSTAPAVPAIEAASPPAVTAPEIPAASPMAAAPAEQPIPQKKPTAVVPASPLPQPSFIEENAPLVYGGGAVIAALLGLLGYRSWKRKRDADIDQAVAMGEVSSASILGMGGGTEPHAEQEPVGRFDSASFDDADLAKETAVDPIQEAEVYMAYGRDAQAEEILHAAKLKDPDNLPVYVKLLEIYSGRGSTTQFNDVATELHDRTSGSGAEWQKAAELGRALDPSNPLYGGADVEAIVDSSEAPLQELDAPVDTPAADVAAAPADIDFDLDLDADFDGEKTVEGLRVPDLDIDLGAAPDAGNSIDFDLGDSLSATPPAETPAPVLDLSSINLDLDTPAVSSVPAAGAADSSEVASKLELAQAYEEMGDRDGARELLQEVLAEGSEAQKEVARNKLAQLD